MGNAVSARGTNRGAIPSDLGGLLDKLEFIEGRLSTLESPSGESLGNTVQRLSDTVAELKGTVVEVQGLVNDLEGRLDNYLETEAPAIIEAQVTAQIAAILAGDVTIGGTLTAPGIRSTDVSGFSDRVVVWVAGDGTVGHT